MPGRYPYASLEVSGQRGHADSASQSAGSFQVQRVESRLGGSIEPRAQHLCGVEADLSGGICRRTDPLAPLNRIGQVGKRTREQPLQCALLSHGGSGLVEQRKGARLWSRNAQLHQDSFLAVLRWWPRWRCPRRASFPCDMLRTRLLIGLGFWVSRWWRCSRVLGRPSLWGVRQPTLHIELAPLLVVALFRFDDARHCYSSRATSTSVASSSASAMAILKCFAEMRLAGSDSFARTVRWSMPSLFILA